MRFLLAAVFLLAAMQPARADLEICNRTSFVIEAAIGIESKGAAATRGWFRVDPGACRVVLRGEPIADHLYLHARALALYGALRPLSAAHIDLCTGSGDFLLAGAKQCAKAEDRLLPFAEVRPSKSGDNSALFVAESAGYDAEQARFAAIQRLLTLAGFDAEPVDGMPGAKSELALAAFLKSRNITAEAALRADFIDLLLAAARDGQAPGLLWCNDTKHAVMAALGSEEDGAVVTRGWWRIEPGACIRPEVPRRASARLYSFAEAVDVSGAVVEQKGRPLFWGGNNRFCVKSIRFEIRDHVNCEARGLDTKAFVPVELSRQSGAMLRFREP
ncbi:MAG: DUF1036 domain-containing protein [Xanthobacteraceae bacterium]|nr:DUF1036 domain-containing protein [Xanthobacteraceae bacterium]